MLNRRDLLSRALLLSPAVLAGLAFPSVGRGESCEILGRSAWGAAPARPGGRSHRPHRVTLHHTAGAVVGSGRAPATLRGIQSFHMGDKGWVDLAYHLFIDADGVAWEGRDPSIVGDTSTDYDPSGHYLICALGNFEEQLPGSAQVEGIVRALIAVQASRGIPVETLAPHRDLAATLCPGKHLVALLDAIRERAMAQSAAVSGGSPGSR